MEEPDDLLDNLILWSEKQGYKFHHFCDTAVLKGDKELLIPSEKQQEASASSKEVKHSSSIEKPSYSGRQI